MAYSCNPHTNQTARLFLTLKAHRVTDQARLAPACFVAFFLHTLAPFIGALPWARQAGSSCRRAIVRPVRSGWALLPFILQDGPIIAAILLARRMASLGQGAAGGADEGARAREALVGVLIPSRLEGVGRAALVGVVGRRTVVPGPAQGAEWAAIAAARKALVDGVAALGLAVLCCVRSLFHPHSRFHFCGRRSQAKWNCHGVFETSFIEVFQARAVLRASIPCKYRWIWNHRMLFFWTL